jgi:hypothetical protein
MEVVMKPSPSVGHLAFGGRLRRRTDGHVRGGGPTVGYVGGRQRRVERPERRQIWAAAARALSMGGAGPVSGLGVGPRRGRVGVKSP